MVCERVELSVILIPVSQIETIIRTICASLVDFLVYLLYLVILLFKKSCKLKAFMHNPFHNLYIKMLMLWITKEHYCSIFPVKKANFYYCTVFSLLSQLPSWSLCYTIEACKRPVTKLNNLYKTVPLIPSWLWYVEPNENISKLITFDVSLQRNVISSYRDCFCFPRKISCWSTIFFIMSVSPFSGLSSIGEVQVS